MIENSFRWVRVLICMKPQTLVTARRRLANHHLSCQLAKADMAALGSRPSGLEYLRASPATPRLRLGFKAARRASDNAVDASWVG